MKLSIIFLFVGLLTACIPAHRVASAPPTATVAAAGAETETPTVIDATFTPSSTPQEASVRDLTISCGLLNSYDLAHFFLPHVETQLAKPQINQVDHPIFSTTRGLSGTEITCTYYSFYHPGSITMTMLQTTYWVDIPVSAAADQVWNQAWMEASARAMQTIPDVADSAFYKDGHLSFKKSDLYMTVETIETDWNLNDPAGMAKQLAADKQVALDMLSHLK